MDAGKLVDAAVAILKAFPGQQLSIYEFVKQELAKRAGRAPGQAAPKASKRTSKTATHAARESADGRQLNDSQTKFVECFSDDDKEFVSAICCGVVQNQRLLDDCVNLLMARNTKLRPSARELYSIFFYQTIFQGGDFKNIRAVLKTQPSPVTLPFLRLVWDDCALG